MSDELPKNSKHTLPFDARFASRPHVHARLHAIADMMDQAMAEGATADQGLYFWDLFKFGRDEIRDGNAGANGK